MPQAVRKYFEKLFLSQIVNFVFTLTLPPRLPTMAPLVPSQEELQRRRVSLDILSKMFDR